MKRFLHALAALWPKRKEVGNPPAPPTSTGLRQHLAAVLRMERALCGFADSPIRGFAEETVGASALSTVRDQLPESPDTRLVDSPDTRLPESSTQQLTESPDTRLIESPDTRLDDSPNQQFVDSPNQPHSLPRIPQPMPLLTILMMVFFMCLMAAPSRVFGAVAADTIPIIEKDLDRFPMVKHDPDLSQVKGLVIGDSIPDYLWDLPLWVVNHPDGRDTMTLREYEGSKLLVLDFWARWCAPCVASMDKWEEYTAELDGDVTLIGAHIDYDYKALPFARKKGWVSPSVIGEGAYIVNRHFFDRNVISRMVWIRDGKLLAITSGGGYDLETVAAVTAGQPVEIPIDPNWTYRPAEPITD